MASSSSDDMVKSYCMKGRVCLRNFSSRCARGPVCLFRLLSESVQEALPPFPPVEAFKAGGRRSSAVEGGRGLSPAAPSTPQVCLERSITIKTR